MEQPTISSDLPQTDSIRELARFWDAHDLTDYGEDLEEVAELVFERRKSIRVQLNPQEADALEHIAQVNGILLEELVHQWVTEKIQAE
jgi:hypothetical protein